MSILKNFFVRILAGSLSKDSQSATLDPNRKLIEANKEEFLKAITNGQSRRKNKPIRVHANEKIRIDVAGIHYRRDVYKAISFNEELLIRFERENPHDKNALDFTIPLG